MVRIYLVYELDLNVSNYVKDTKSVVRNISWIRKKLSASPETLSELSKVFIITWTSMCTYWLMDVASLFLVKIIFIRLRSD